MQDRATDEKEEQAVNIQLAPLKRIASLEVKLDGKVKLTALSPEKLAIYSEEHGNRESIITYFNPTTQEHHEEKQGTFTVYTHSIGFEYFVAQPETPVSIGFTDIPSFLYVKHSGNPLNHPYLHHMRYATIMPDQEHLALWGTRYHSLTIVIFNLTHSTAYRHIFPLFGHTDGECQILPASNQQLFIQQRIQNPGSTFKFKLYSLQFDSANGIPNYRIRPKLSDAIFVRTRHLSMTISPDGNWLATTHTERIAGTTEENALCISAYGTELPCLRKYDYLCSTEAWGDTLTHKIASAPNLSGHWLPNSAGYLFNYKSSYNQRHYSYYVDMKTFVKQPSPETAPPFSMTNDGNLWALNTVEKTLWFTFPTASAHEVKTVLYGQLHGLPTVLIDIIVDYTNDIRSSSPEQFIPSPCLPKTLQDEMKNLMVKYTGNKAEYKINVSALTFFNNLLNSKRDASPEKLIASTQAVCWNFFRRKHRHPCSRFFKKVIQQKETKETSATAPSRGCVT